MALNEDQQTEAVFKSSRDKVDPVSGNEVPPGSLPEEVRDDIPAMLSEGEYVVPADVLRFYGVKFFEDLRAQAKMGLAEMEANGRIGGEPIEEETGDVGVSDEDLMVIMAQELQEEQAVGAAKGGVMGFQAGGLNYPAYIKQPDITQFGMAGPDFQGGLEYRTYVNDAGLEITIPFFDGQPMGMIPPGYTLKSDAATATEQAAPQKVGGDDDGPSPEDLDRPEAVDYSTLTDEELSEALDQNNTAKSVVTGLGVVNPAIAVFGRLATAHQRSQITEEMSKRGIEVPEDESPLSNIIEGVKSFFSKDEDNNKDKDTTPTAPTPNESEPFSGTPQGPTAAQEAQAEAEATIGLDAFGGSGDDNDDGDDTGDTSGSSGSSSSVSGTNDGEVGEATGGQGDQGKGSGKGGMNQGGMMQKPKNKKKK